jgi:hypothetical protein
MLALQGGGRMEAEDEDDERAPNNETVYSPALLSSGGDVFRSLGLCAPFSTDTPATLQSIYTAMDLVQDTASSADDVCISPSAVA